MSDQIKSKSRRTYSQRNVSSLQLELTKNRKMINMNTTKTTLINRTLSFKPLSETSSSLANVENTPMKKLSCKLDTSTIISTSQEVIEETPVKDKHIENETIPSDRMARDIQKLTLRLRSSVPLFDIPIMDNQPTKPTTLHLSQVVNRVSRCNHVLRHFVREAQKYSPKSNEIQLTSKPILSLPPHEKGRRRLFVDSPQQNKTNPIDENQLPKTPRKAKGVIKQLFASPSPSFKRTASSTNTNIKIIDKRQKLF
ncbi:unnamed protein product [Adineta steineri]|uniref:Uncharacterized protein n=3 Tax=Adineta steineri TaxID=433720 RepID=A0A818XGN9_9BILA|nr:unnamed protein product [Adineta steineri]CAF3739402.1 unnamed protein product [Adineta steineri]